MQIEFPDTTRKESMQLSSDDISASHKHEYWLPADYYFDRTGIVVFTDLKIGWLNSMVVNWPVWYASAIRKIWAGAMIRHI